MSEVGVAIRLPSAASAPTREPWWQRLLVSRSGAVGAAAWLEQEWKQLSG